MCLKKSIVIDKLLLVILCIVRMNANMKKSEESIRECTLAGNQHLKYNMQLCPALNPAFLSSLLINLRLVFL